MTFNFLVRKRIWGVEVFFLEAKRLMGAWHFDHSQYFPLDAIIKARVVNVLPQLEAAIVDLGQGRHGFLKNQHIPAIFSQSKGWTRFSVGQGSGNGSLRQTPIGDKLKSGDLILVQVDKLPQGEKQYQVTADIGLQSLLWVYRPLSEGARIPHAMDDESHLRFIQAWVDKEPGHWALRSMARRSVCCEQLGFLELLVEEANQLQQAWQHLARALQGTQSTGLIRQSLDWFMPIRTLLNTAWLDECADKPNIWISPELKQDLKTFSVLEKVVCVVQVNQDKYAHKEAQTNTWAALEKQWQIEAQLKIALQPKVTLMDAHGGEANLRFEQHEAMMTVDVNSGNLSTGKGNPEAKSQSTGNFKVMVNEQALALVSQQLSIRNAHGMILIDWISLQPKKWLNFKQKVALLLKKDPWVMSIKHFPEKHLTLVERSSLGQTLLETNTIACSQCQGVGRILGPETYARQVLVKIEAIIEQGPDYFKCYLVQLSDEVHQCLQLGYSLSIQKFSASHALELKWEVHRRAWSDFQICPANVGAD